MSFATWSQTAASNTSVGGLSLDGATQVVSNLDNIVRGEMAELAVARDDGTIIAVYPRGYLHGLTLSNNAGDATNDIDIAVGECVASSSPYWRMALASSLTKRLDAAWAVGTGNGGLDTGAIANTTYHVWLIARSDTGVVDALFSTSATNPTMPANYDRKRRIGSIIRAGAAILAFFQNGDVFRLSAAPASWNNTGAQASILSTWAVPAGIIVRPILQAQGLIGVSSSIQMNLGSAAAGTADIAVAIATTGAGDTTDGYIFALPSIFFTNTASQTYLSQTVSGTVTAATIRTIGWYDDRGRES